MRCRLLAFVALAACSPQPLPIPLPADAGVEADAGAADAGLDTGLADAGAPDAGAFDAGLTYVDDVHPMFERAGCSTFGCHGSVIGGVGVLVYLPEPRTGWLDMVNRESVTDSGVIVVPGDSSRSVLAIHGREALVPFNVLTVAEQRLVERWIDEGARYSRTERDAPAGGLFPSQPGTATTCNLGDARGTPELPAACLPRCSAMTWQQVVDCRTAPNPTACQNMAISADPTPPVLLGGGQDVISVSCDTCLDLQTRSCVDEHCRLELLAFDRCRALTTGTCTAEQSRVFACASTAAFKSCQRTRDARCAAP